MELLLGTLEIECTVADMPESIPVNIKGLQLNQSIHAGEIELPAGFKMITEASAPVVTCKEPAVIKEPEAAAEGAEGAAPAEPEVITERKKEEAAE